MTYYRYTVTSKYSGALCTTEVTREELYHRLCMHRSDFFIHLDDFVPENWGFEVSKVVYISE